MQLKLDDELILEFSCILKGYWNHK
jgi:hypothetical protein